MWSIRTKEKTVKKEKGPVRIHVHLSVVPLRSLSYPRPPFANRVPRITKFASFLLYIHTERASRGDASRAASRRFFTAYQTATALPRAELKIAEASCRLARTSRAGAQWATAHRC